MEKRGRNHSFVVYARELRALCYTCAYAKNYIRNRFRTSVCQTFPDVPHVCNKNSFKAFVSARSRAAIVPRIFRNYRKRSALVRLRLCRARRLDNASSTRFIVLVTEQRHCCPGCYLNGRGTSVSTSIRPSQCPSRLSSRCSYVLISFLLCMCVCVCASLCKERNFCKIRCKNSKFLSQKEMTRIYLETHSVLE